MSRRTGFGLYGFAASIALAASASDAGEAGGGFIMFDDAYKAERAAAPYVERAIIQGKSGAEAGPPSEASGSLEIFWSDGRARDVYTITNVRWATVDLGRTKNHFGQDHGLCRFMASLEVETADGVKADLGLLATRYSFGPEAELAHFSAYLESFDEARPVVRWRTFEFGPSSALDFQVLGVRVPLTSLVGDVRAIEGVSVDLVRTEDDADGRSGAKFVVDATFKLSPAAEYFAAPEMSEVAEAAERPNVHLRMRGRTSVKPDARSRAERDVALPLSPELAGVWHDCSYAASASVAQ